MAFQFEESLNVSTKFQSIPFIFLNAKYVIITVTLEEKLSHIVLFTLNKLSHLKLDQNKCI